MSQIASDGADPTSARTGGTGRLHDQAAEILEWRIRAGAIAGGTRLLESRVAAEFGISRAPARQALVALERAGLLSRDNARGYLVTDLGGSGEAVPEAPGPIQLSPAAGWERIYADIESSIVSRTAYGSWRVVETEIAKHYGVSRTIARDVIARLNQRGLIRKDERSHWYAPALTRDHVAELYEMRWTLEPLALEKAAPFIPGERIGEALASLTGAMERAELTGADLDGLENDLHVGLLGYCGQQTLMEALHSYQSLLVAHRFLYRWMPALYVSEPFLPEHLEVLQALESGRIAVAAERLRWHLQVSLDRALARIEVIAAEVQPEPLPYLFVIQ